MIPAIDSTAGSEVELRSPTTWEVYEQILRIPYYVVFDRYTNDFRAFRLVATRYEELELAPQKLDVTEMQDESKRNFKHPASLLSLDSVMPKLWLNEVELGLGVWLGVYQGTEGLWLRWYDGAGRWLPTLAEQAEEERQRADRLAAKLRELGIDLEGME